jgi:hypothetical protein
MAAVAGPYPTSLHSREEKKCLDIVLDVWHTYTKVLDLDTNPETT